MSGAVGVSGARPSAPDPYFVSPLVDALCMGGASILVFPLVFWLHDGLRTDTVVRLGAALLWVVNWPHFSATSYRLYRSRANVRRYPVTALVVPAFLVFAIVGAAASPDLLAVAFVHLFLLWSPFHFSGQTVGLSLLYARRAGFPVGDVERRALSLFVFGTFVLQTARAEGMRNQGSFYGVTYPTLGLSDSVVRAATALLLLSGVAFAVLVVVASRRARRVVPPIVLLPSLAQFTWFVLGPTRQSYAEFVPFFHSLEYLLVAWAVHVEETGGKREDGAIRFLVGTSARFFAVNVAGGALLFFVLPRVLGLTGVALPLATAVVFSGVQIHHFFVDGVIWKLRDPGVRNPLMGSVKRFLSVALVALVALGVSTAQAAPAPAKDPRRVVLRTVLGDLVLALYPGEAPRTVRQIERLVEAGAYDGTRFARVEPGYVAQIGTVQDRLTPLSAAQAAMVGKLPLERNSVVHRPFVLSMAHPDGEPDGAETSFSVLLAPAPHLDGHYTVFGEVEAGEDVLRALESVGTEQRRATILKAELLDEAALALAPRRPARRPAGTARRIDASEHVTSGAPAASAGRALSRDATVLVSAVAAMSAIGVFTFFVAARRRMRTLAALGLLQALIGFFVCFAWLAPITNVQGGGSALLLFVLTLGLFKLLGRFESDVVPESPLAPEPVKEHPVRADPE